MPQELRALADCFYPDAVASGTTIEQWINMVATQYDSDPGALIRVIGHLDRILANSSDAELKANWDSASSALAFSEHGTRQFLQEVLAAFTAMQVARLQ